MIPRERGGVCADCGAWIWLGLHTCTVCHRTRVRVGRCAWCDSGRDERNRLSRRHGACLVCAARAEAWVYPAGPSGESEPKTYRGQDAREITRETKFGTGR